MHNVRIFADVDSVGASVEINAFVDINATLQSNVAGETDAHVVFDGDQAIKRHNQSIRICPQTNANNGGNPAKERQDNLLDDVTPGICGLAIEIE